MPDSSTLDNVVDSPRAISPSRTEDSSRAFVRGIELGLPIFLGYMPVGMAFGVLAMGLGFSPISAVVCSATALAGAGQFIALSVLAAGGGVVSVIVATTVVNLRYLLFGMTLSPHLRATPMRTQSWLAFTLTDETFAVNIADVRKGEATGSSMAGVGAIAWSGWVLGTIVGVIGAGWIGDPERWGLQFAMPAMFAALFVALAEDRRHVIVGAAAAALALAVPLVAHLGIELQPSWATIIAAVGAATVATLVFDE